LTPKVDPDLCIGCGLCSEICPEVFEMGDDGLAHVIDAGGCEAAGCCEEAAESCPTSAISLD
jgi:ferredoxin